MEIKGNSVPSLPQEPVFTTQEQWDSFVEASKPVDTNNYVNTVPNSNLYPQKSPCKTCGRCPECGQPQPVPQFYPYWYNPVYPTYPTWYSNTGSMTCQSNPSFKDGMNT